MKKVFLIAALVGGAAFAADGKAIYDAECKSCHGVDGKTKALGKSAPIAGMSADTIEKSLTEYKAGTLNKYGTGAVMKASAAKLSPEDAKAVAGYVATLK